MTRPRIIETDQGIQGEFTVTIYDQMQRRLRDKGWIETEQLLKQGITQGRALEVGPGPGYLGLEWLKRTQGTSLTGLDISPDMIAVAERNAREYGVADRAEYVRSSGSGMPFGDHSFDAVLSNGSLHEWADPRATFGEVWRVLKPGGKLLISDLRRDMFAPLRWYMWANCQPKEIRPGFITSINASYTPGELMDLIRGTTLQNCTVSSNLFGLMITGEKRSEAVG